MKKRSLSVVIISVLIMFLMPVISAGIFFSELNSKYNFGDTIELNAKVDPIVNDRLLKIVLFCNGNNVIEFNNLPDEQGNVNIKLPLNYYTIKEANGNCFFFGEYVGENRQSNEFEISKLLIVKLAIESFFANPGEEIIISGTAEKLNGASVNGEVEVNIPLLNLLQIPEEQVAEEIRIGNESATETESNSTALQVSENDTQNFQEQTEQTTPQETQPQEETQEANFNAGKFYGKVNDKQFSLALRLPENTPAGDYRIDVLVYEQVDGYRTSEGIAYGSLKVFKVLKNIELAINNFNFDPGTNIDIKVTLLDQTGSNIDGEVSVVVKNENQKYFEKIGKSQENIQYLIPSNLTSGYYDVIVSSSGGEFTASKKIFVNEKAIASFNLANDTLVVANIGNIPYRKDIQVELNGRPFIKRVNLDLGESTKFRLTGAEDLYTIKISDGESEIIQEGIKLTGSVINVAAVGEPLPGLYNPIVWIFLAVVLLIGILFLVRNAFKKKSFAYHEGKEGVVLRPKKSEEVQESQEDPKKMFKLEQSSQFTPFYGKADHVLVSKGYKSQSAVLVIKAKNKVGKAGREFLEKAIDYIYDNKGAVYEQGDYILAVFSPLMTGSNKNEVLASRSAKKIFNDLISYNKLIKEKINFGLAVNSGEIINKVEEGKLKFTALGNFVTAGKRLAELANSQIFLSKSAYERGISEIKANKKKFNGAEVYELADVADFDKSKKFIKEFLERQKKDNVRKVDDKTKKFIDDFLERQRGEF